MTAVGTSINIVLEARVEVEGSPGRAEALDQLKEAVFSTDNVRLVTPSETFTLKVREIDVL